MREARDPLILLVIWLDSNPAEGHRGEKSQQTQTELIPNAGSYPVWTQVPRLTTTQ